MNKCLSAQMFHYALKFNPIDSQKGPSLASVRKVKFECLLMANKIGQTSVLLDYDVQTVVSFICQIRLVAHFAAPIYFRATCAVRSCAAATCKNLRRQCASLTSITLSIVPRPQSSMTCRAPQTQHRPRKQWDRKTNGRTDRQTVRARERLTATRRDVVCIAGDKLL